MERKLSRKKAHREHVIRNMATSLVLYEYLETTEAKAKEAKSYLDKLLARSKSDDLNTRRQLAAVLFDKNAVKKVMDELIPRYTDRKSGFIKSFHLTNRLGDNAPMMRLELVDKKVFVDKPAVTKEESKEKNIEAEPKAESRPESVGKEQNESK